MGQRHDDLPTSAGRPSQSDPAPTSATAPTSPWPPSAERTQTITDPSPANREPHSGLSSSRPSAIRPVSSRISPAPASPRPLSPFSQALVPSDSTRGRRAQDDFDYQQSQGFPERRTPAEDPSTLSAQRPAHPAEPSGPAWLYAPPTAQTQQKPVVPAQSPVQSSVADTLQHSRERVAARWFALKGVFEQPGPDQQEAAPVRQKETRTPVLAVFSLAGGVGKTSLVATVGRALSSMGEKVLLTDTTSHGLLPYYFGASELRQGTVRTFSPPSGSTDAPIYLVSYDIDQKGSDDIAHEQLTDEIISNSRGMHRILLDLTPASSWIVRRMSRLNPTILVPVAPDMNSVISLQMVEKFFAGVNDGDGRPLLPFYVLNQFDTSLPLHLDVREVMRRQLGDRLLPFVIRRAPSVSEALAEGMTVVDYAPDAPVAEDYLNLATWLRTVAAPATAGFRNMRWSER
jgi:cellulose synthase operon protein YhjQ